MTKLSELHVQLSLKQINHHILYRKEGADNQGERRATLEEFPREVSTTAGDFDAEDLDSGDCGSPTSHSNSSPVPGPYIQLSPFGPLVSK
jgi:hypothetical protein